MLSYSRQSIDVDDVAAVIRALRSGWLTTGPHVCRFEAALADEVGAAHAVAVSSGTSALQAALFAAGVGPGDEVIVPAMTFVATAGAAVPLGADPVVVDVDPETLLVDPRCVADALGPRTRAIVAVDYAGQPAPYPALRDVIGNRDVALIADACHALGGALDDRAVGTLADLTAFSFHPVKAITCGEGGAVTTNDGELAERMRRFRNHGISRDHHERAATGSWRYDVEHFGGNHRLSDLQSALAESQLARLPAFIARRREIAAAYDAALAGRDGVRPLTTWRGAHHARHLYVVGVERRDAVFSAMRERGIGVNVHYAPLHLLTALRRYSTSPGDCPAAEAAGERILSLPCFPAMTDGDVEAVLRATEGALAATGAQARETIGASS